MARHGGGGGGAGGSGGGGVGGGVTPRQSAEKLMGAARASAGRLPVTHGD